MGQHGAESVCGVAVLTGHCHGVNVLQGVDAPAEQMFEHGAHSLPPGGEPGGDAHGITQVRVGVEVGALGGTDAGGAARSQQAGRTVQPVEGIGKPLALNFTDQDLHGTRSSGSRWNIYIVPNPPGMARGKRTFFRRLHRMERAGRGNRL